MEETAKLVETITKGIQEKKGENITIVDLKGIDGAITKYFIICQGNSPAQIEAITESIGDMARIDLGEKPVNVVGLGTDQWVAMDYVDVLVHVFLPEARQFYDLENLWQDAKLTNIPNLD
uniref:Ribosomal silencing factor RsfS n=5 Tax=unclassified Prevotella TaxID=2638335 RepID=A0AB33JM05_9BACT